MKKLELINVKEMSVTEMKNTDGGIIPILIVAVVGWGSAAVRTAAVAGLAYIVGKDVVGDYKRGYEDGNK